MVHKVWHSAIVHEYEFDPGAGAKPFGPTITEFSTIERMLVSCGVSAVQLGVGPTAAPSLPRVNLSIGYDKASDHIGEQYTPRNHNTFDFMFDAVIPWTSISKVWNGTSYDQVYTGALDGVMSVQGQRKLVSPNLYPFYILWIAPPEPNPIDIVTYLGCLHIRTLYNMQD